MVGMIDLQTKSVRSSRNRVPARIGRRVRTSTLLIERTMSGQSATFATIANAVTGAAAMGRR
jgi:hypothetical protein